MSAIPWPERLVSPRRVFQPTAIIPQDRGSEPANGAEFQPDWRVVLRVRSVWRRALRPR